MAINLFQTLDVIEIMENFVESIRPPEEIRHKLDLSYKIENQSIILFEIRPHWEKPQVIMEFEVAKTTYIKASNHWKIFWLRSDLKWHSYKPLPIVKTLSQFVEAVRDDKYHCFWG